jgi:uncharacterized protein YbjQ (UPF0145 family)
MKNSAGHSGIPASPGLPDRRLARFTAPDFLFALVSPAPYAAYLLLRPMLPPPVLHDVILTNLESVPGRQIVEHYGLVSGSTVRAKHFGRDIAAGLKNLVGGELKGYTELLHEARQESTARMVAQARALGANAVINIRYSTSSVAQGAAELYAYGTAVRVA